MTTALSPLLDPFASRPRAGYFTLPRSPYAPSITPSANPVTPQIDSNAPVLLPVTNSQHHQNAVSISQSVLRSPCAPNNNAQDRQRQKVSRKHSKRSRQAANVGVRPSNRISKHKKNVNQHGTRLQKQISSRSDFSLEGKPDITNSTPRCRFETSACRNSSSQTLTSGSRDSSTEPFPKLNSAELCTPVASAVQPTPSPRDLSGHRHRNSEASSAFVHTVKTASFSNGSLSVLPLSAKTRRSSEYQNNWMRMRYSIDSQRPRSIFSADDSTIERGIKRRRILEELMYTEESYVADLKALVYLYSTLLASTSSISTSVRMSIQRNATNLLQLHEKLADSLHRAALHAAARKWADTVYPTNLSGAHYLRWTNAESQSPDLLMRGSLQTRHSAKVVEVPPNTHTLASADMADVLDIVRLLYEILPSLSLYEEYCANHEIIAHELQRQTPLLWTTVEAGMESLARTLLALDRKKIHGRKGVTIGDLLIKPIQRICRYPLLLQDLLCNTPVIDGPGAHEALNTIVQQLHHIVQDINEATDNQISRAGVRRRWQLQARLNLVEANISEEQFRELGQIHLCGALHITYQTIHRVEGCFGACVLFDRHFLIALPDDTRGSFRLLALLKLSDLRIESPSDGKGLQCPSAFHTSKLSFAVDGDIHEVLLSACSTEEEDQWLSGLEGEHCPDDTESSFLNGVRTQSFVRMRSVGKVFSTDTPLARQTPIQRAATVGNRAALCHVILRNTHNPQDLQEFRNSAASQMSRSNSHGTANKLIVLAPKRSERARLEMELNDVWTKDKIPFPGIIANKGSQILRASAGSLVRKLSFASIQGPFSRRSASITVSSKKSYDALSERPRSPPTFRIRRRSISDSTPIRPNRPNDVPELDTMDSLIGRMIGGGSSGNKRLSFTGGEKTLRKVSKNIHHRGSIYPVRPEDPAAVFYEETEKGGGDTAMDVVARNKLRNSGRGVYGTSGSSRRKRWSKPISKLKGFVLKA